MRGARLRREPPPLLRMTAENKQGAWEVLEGVPWWVKEAGPNLRKRYFPRPQTPCSCPTLPSPDTSSSLGTLLKNCSTQIWLFRKEWCSSVSLKHPWPVLRTLPATPPPGAPSQCGVYRYKNSMCPRTSTVVGTKICMGLFLLHDFAFRVTV